MSVLQALILGIVQGLTEFLPVSSSGHLVLGQKLLGFTTPPVAFDVLIHVATLIAILIFFKKELLKDIKEIWEGKNPKIFWLLVIGTIPAVVIGLLVKPFLDKIFNSTFLVGFSLIFTSLLLSSTKFIKKGIKKLEDASLFNGFFVGLFQALAILPGVSRSGSTVVAGLVKGLKQEEAFKLSFYLAIPAIFGAQLLEIKKLLELGNGMAFSHLVGFLAALFTGIWALKIFKKMVIKGQLVYFAFYCFVIGSIVIIISL